MGSQTFFQSVYQKLTDQAAEREKPQNDVWGESTNSNPSHNGLTPKQVHDSVTVLLLKTPLQSTTNTHSLKNANGIMSIIKPRKHHRDKLNPLWHHQPTYKDHDILGPC